MKLSEMLNLAGQTAVVTGGGTHLGRALTSALCELGATVHIAARNRERLDKTAAELVAQGHRCYPHACDATQESEVAALMDRVAELSGDPSIMVCNAGGSVTSGYAPDIALKDWHATLAISLDTALICSQAAAKRMIPKRSGRIITIGSIHGSLGPDLRTYGSGYRRGGSSYHAAKGAVIQLTRSLAVEWGRYGITVNCISPGQIPLPGTDPETVELFRQNNPLGETGLPDDLKGALALVATPAGRWITGQNIVVDGGWSIW